MAGSSGLGEREAEWVTGLGEGECRAGVGIEERKWSLELGEGA